MLALGKLRQDARFAIEGVLGDPTGAIAVGHRQDAALLLQLGELMVNGLLRHRGVHLFQCKVHGGAHHIHMAHGRLFFRDV